jgi:hypothetical protein
MHKNLLRSDSVVNAICPVQMANSVAAAPRGRSRILPDSQNQSDAEALPSSKRHRESSEPLHDRQHHRQDGLDEVFGVAGIAERPANRVGEFCLLVYVEPVLLAECPHSDQEALEAPELFRLALFFLDILAIRGSKSLYFAGNFARECDACLGIEPFQCHRFLRSACRARGLASGG